MTIEELISLTQLAETFSAVPELSDKGFQWLREKPGRVKEGEEAPMVGNSLAVGKLLRTYNTDNPDRPVFVYKVTGYDGTAKEQQVIARADIIRLSKYIKRGAVKKGVCRVRSNGKFELTLVSTIIPKIDGNEELEDAQFADAVEGHDEEE